MLKNMKLSADYMLTNDIINAKQTAIKDSSGKFQKIQHRDISTNILIREDVFTYNGNITTEVRTLVNSGKKRTYIYHLDTLVVEVIE